MPSHVPLIAIGDTRFRPDAPPSVSKPAFPHEPQSPARAAAGLKRPCPVMSDHQHAKRPRLNVLAPFYNPPPSHREGVDSLRHINNELRALAERRDRASPEIRPIHENIDSSQLLPEPPGHHGTKRKSAPVSPMKLGSGEGGGHEHTTNGQMLHLANQIYTTLDETVAHETIHLCGFAPLQIMASRPDEVLDLAHQKLHSWPYKNVPMCWRRLYEDATLSKAANMMREEAARMGDAMSIKRRRMDVESFCSDRASPDWLTDLVTTFDKGITLTGTPGRASVFEAVLQQLESNVKLESTKHVPDTFVLGRQKPLQTHYPITRAVKAVNFEAFQLHLDQTTRPIIIPGVLRDWPAMSLWQNPKYLLHITLGGRRLIPVEVGRTYLDEQWSQKMMAFRDFMTDFLLPEEPKEVGYLAQHDLFAQVPALKNDITVPDYCYATPPHPDKAVSSTAGLDSAGQLDEPLLNAWLGPRGTKTPLHTDPYHNILCQVVGYKYVRLYPPTETTKVYPCGLDVGNGIDMSNTSQVDVSLLRCIHWPPSKQSSETDAQQEEYRKFPLLNEAKFVEAVLGPGECLYIPLGWWHYVESLSTSFSVSFWWN